MPRILRIINRFNLGGPTYNAALLTKYLNDGYETMLIGGQHLEHEGSSQHILDDLGIKAHTINNMQRDVSFANDRNCYREIKKIIHTYKPDIIHTHASKAGAIGRAAGIAYGKAKIVHTFHGHVFHSYFGNLKTMTYKNIERVLAKKTNKIIAISDIQKEELTKIHHICPDEKVAVIPLGFDLSRFHVETAQKRKIFRAKYKLEEDEIAIGIVGRLVPIKNHRLFLMAFKEIIEKTEKKVRAFIVGDGIDRANLLQLAQELGIDYEHEFDETATEIKKASLHFTSWITEIDLVYAGIDILALSSLNEGTPVSLIEGQASAVPVISTNVGGVANIVVEGKTALLCESHNLEDFTSKLLQVINNDQLRKELSLNSWEFVKDRFHYNRLVESTRSLYNSLLN